MFHVMKLQFDFYPTDAHGVSLLTNMTLVDEVPMSLLSNEPSVCLPFNIVSVHLLREVIPVSLLHNEFSVCLLSNEAHFVFN